MSPNHHLEASNLSYAMVIRLRKEFQFKPDNKNNNMEKNGNVNHLKNNPSSSKWTLGYSSFIKPAKELRMIISAERIMVTTNHY